MNEDEILEAYQETCVRLGQAQITARKNVVKLLVAERGACWVSRHKSSILERMKRAETAAIERIQRNGIATEPDVSHPAAAGNR